MSSLSIDDTWAGGYSAASRLWPSECETGLRVMLPCSTFWICFLLSVTVHTCGVILRKYFYISEICSDDAHCSHIFMWLFYTLVVLLLFFLDHELTAHNALFLCELTKSGLPLFIFSLWLWIWYLPNYMDINMKANILLYSK